MRRWFLVAFLCAVSAGASDFPRELNVFVGAGRSLTSWHGSSSYRQVEFQFVGRPRFVARFLPRTDAGVSLAYSDIRQPRSWFGSLYGDPNDSVRGEWTYLFLRHGWRENAATQPYVELGSGPMWSNRRVPAATSRFNFHSQLGIGTRLFATSHPVFVVYRFSHISNLLFGPHNPGAHKRNPGWDVNTIMIGTRLHAFHR